MSKRKSSSASAHIYRKTQYTLFSLFILYVIFQELMIHEWGMAGVVFALEMAVTFVFFGATAITILLEGINGKLFGFILG